jgi:hypothetical protein
MQRFDFFQKFLMVAGLVFIMGLIGVQSGRFDLIEGLKSFVAECRGVGCR